MSGWHPLCRPAFALPRASALARSSLCLFALFMATPACLVTSTPSFEPPKRTAPFLVAASALPDVRNMILMDARTTPSKVFSAEVVSEDNGQQVLGLLYVDYGYNPPGTDQPFRAMVANIRELDPSTLTDPNARTMRVTWLPEITGTSSGCHTVTLIASHDFDRETQCPKCLSDSSQITWQVFVCNSAIGDDCKPDFSACAQWTKSCEAVPNPDDAAQCGGSP
jgi:hypothetical protein